jgi:ribosome maturation factor RimP
MYRVTLRGGPPARFFITGIPQPATALLRRVIQVRGPSDDRIGTTPTMMQVQDRIAALITGPLEGMGYELVRVQLSGGTEPVLQIMADRADGAAMTVDDCADISRGISALLDTEDPIAGTYTLEVSSPGIDRPLTRPIDFERYAGFDAKIETRAPIDGRRRFKGQLRGLEGDQVLIDVDGETRHLTFDDIAKAQLVLTDELIAAVGAA